MQKLDQPLMKVGESARRERSKYLKRETVAGPSLRCACEQAGGSKALLVGSKVPAGGLI